MRQRPISSVPDWTLQTAPTTFFRSALTRLLQTTSSILPDEIAAPTAGSPSRVRTKPNQLRVWAGARRRRAGLSRIRAVVSNCPLGVSHAPVRDADDLGRLPPLQTPCHDFQNHF